MLRIKVKMIEYDNSLNWREMSVPKYSEWASLCSLQGICTTTTAFLHFFFLASFCWVLTEAWQSYMAVTGKIRTRLIRKRFLCLGWGKSVNSFPQNHWNEMFNAATVSGISSFSSVNLKDSRQHVTKKKTRLGAFPLYLKLKLCCCIF